MRVLKCSVYLLLTNSKHRVTWNCFICENLFLKRKSSNSLTFSSHKGPYCLQTLWFTAVIMGLSRLNIKEEIQSSKYDHRIYCWPLVNKKRPQSYWLRQHCLLCLCWTPHYSAHDDTLDKNHFWPTWGLTRLQPAAYQTGSQLLSFFLSFLQKMQCF